MRGISCRLSPIPDHAFFEQAVLEGQVGRDLLQGGGLPTQVLPLVRRGSPRRVAGEPLLARLEEVLRPAIIHRRGDAVMRVLLQDADKADKPGLYAASVELRARPPGPSTIEEDERDRDNDNEHRSY